MTLSLKRSCCSADTTVLIIWETHGFGMGRPYSGRRRHLTIILPLLLVRCCSPIRMAGLIFSADSTVNSISSRCGSGTAPTGRSYLHQVFHLLALQRLLRQALPPVRSSCLVVWLMLTRTTPGPT